MTSDALLVLQSVFSTILTLFNSWYIPGTRTTPLEFAVFSLAVVFSIRLIRRLLFHGDDSND